MLGTCPSLVSSSKKVPPLLPTTIPRFIFHIPRMGLFRDPLDSQFLFIEANVTHRTTFLDRTVLERRYSTHESD
ncbi:hypothetical protein TNIN_254601 [Trichonephila inaurata madagascariensis]|uniref:Uncharacterized protein n=1 Tax=Trichonephila inaurata madagascariensis TaxID=2747483 RepID=A0A8X6XDU2_9ARAC|nr:hypothetical protein TNIN_254601 [Trichonephila inaurata madagascariensis]